MKKTKDRRVLIFDTTLRDGEQCPGASMGLQEKLEVARQLARLQVDIIEAGFPIASPGDFEAVREVAQRIKGPRIAGLARCLEKDIVRAAEAIAPAGARGRIHVFLATSEIHRRFKLRKAKQEIVRQAVMAVRLARRYCDDVQFSPEDASRTEPDFLAEVTRAVIDAGAGTVNIPDTVGYSIPSEFGNVIAELRERVPALDNVVLHVHCHNDLGLAVANSLAAVEQGARGVECTINGIGERAGNCSLEEFVMILRTRADRLGLWTGIRSTELYPASRLVSQMTGLLVQRNKAIVGANAFAHEAGIHQDGILKERTTYEIMRPQDVGVRESELVLGKHSGRHAFSTQVAKMGFRFTRAELDPLYDDFIALADKKKHVYDDDLTALVQARLMAVPEVWTLAYLHVSAGTGTVPTATVRMKRGTEDFEDAACGDGPVDAALKTIDRITGLQGKLLDYALQAITRGKDAVGEVTLSVQFDGHTVAGKASSTDIVEASARAYLNSINRYLWSQREQANAHAAPAPRGRAKKARAPGRRPRGRTG